MHRLTALAATLSLVCPLSAGPLNPPRGPIAPTMKTLEQVEPRTPIGPDTTPGDANCLFRITSPGSYYLTGNVTGVAGKSGIVVAAPDVTIDLMGFTMRGVPDSISGISGPPGIGGAFYPNLVVRNGTVADWGLGGVHATVIEGVRATGNAGVGMSCAEEGVVRNCVATLNGNAGIAVGENALVEDCLVSYNGHQGIHAAENTTIRACVATHNSAGIAAKFGSAIIACTARDNQFSGLAVESGVISSCAVYGTGSLASGIVAAAPSQAAPRAATTSAFRPPQAPCAVARHTITGSASPLRRTYPPRTAW